MINKEKLILKAVTKSPWVTHLNTGSCNGCDIEILAALTPRYDVERLGIVLKPSPRHADVILATGSVTYQTKERVQRIIDQIPDPKLTVAIGTCACSGGVFQECFNTMGGVDKITPVAAYIPGCPPRPEAIVQGVAALIDALLNPKPEPEESESSKTDEMEIAPEEGGAVQVEALQEVKI
ncbi:MAG: NADH-quinone oxidoreductase subunit B family protein [Candidatus Hodarchaeales archaeon]|jgi:Ni,Fe-hydrogenase III small subunit